MYAESLWLFLPTFISTLLTPKSPVYLTTTSNQATAFAKKIYFALVASRCSSCVGSHFLLLLTSFVEAVRMMLNGSQLTVLLDIISSITLYIGESHIMACK